MNDQFLSVSSVSASSVSASSTQSQAPVFFVFLEIFEREGGIQSYVKDIFQSYLTLTDTPSAEIFLLRDSHNCSNPFESSTLTFHYFKTRSAAMGRLYLAVSLFRSLLWKRPQRVFCGHIKLAPLIELLCRPLGIPYTVLTYGKEVWETLPERDRQALDHADQMWTISRYTRDRACTANQLNPQKVALLPCAVDGEQFTPGQKSPELLHKYGLTHSRILMTVARLWSGDIYKGVDITIRALPTIAEAYPDIKYLVIGRGDDQPRLAKLAHDLGMGDRVIFAGFVATEDLPDHYRLADAYVMPSQEGFGIVYLEAMACGVPVLSGDADGSSDPLQDGTLGWQVPHRDSSAVAHACIELLKGDDQRCEGVWLREQALALFGKEAFAKQLQRLIASSS
ncbi:MAG TPA: glycosyltransferase family 4 protein [Elainellaceae cyanobacterium]